MSLSTDNLQSLSPSVPATATFDVMQWAMSIIQTSNYQLTVDVNELLSPERSRKRKSKGRACTNPPRPKNAFILFLTDFEARVRRETPMARIRDVAARAGIAWRNASHEIFHLFHSLEAVAKELHRIAYPGYSYRAVKSPRKPRLRKGVRDENATVASSKARKTRLRRESAASASTPYAQNSTVAEVLGPTVSASTTCGGEETVAINGIEQSALDFESGEYYTSSLPVTHATHDHMLAINLHYCYYYYYYNYNNCACPQVDHVSSMVSATPSSFFPASTNPSEYVDFLHQAPHALDSYLLPSGDEGARDAVPTHEVWSPDEQCYFH